jgi:hypothetical protein
MQRHECNKHNFLCINDSLKFLFPFENLGVTTLQGKPDTHDTYAFHASPRTPLIRFMRAVPVCGSLLC